MTSRRPEALKYAREKSILVSRSAVYVNVEMTRSTRLVVKSGSRAAVGAQTRVLEEELHHVRQRRRLLVRGRWCQRRDLNPYSLAGNGF